MKRIFIILVGACSHAPNGAGPDANRDAHVSDVSAPVDAELLVDLPPETLCGQPLPAAASPSLSNGGFAELSPQSTTEPGILISLWRNNEASPLASTVTNTRGYFTMMVPTHGIPVTGYLHAARTDFVDTYRYPFAPLTATGGYPSHTPLFTHEAEALFHENAMADPTRGIAYVVPTECNFDDMFDFTISAPGAFVRYIDMQDGSLRGSPSATTYAAVIDAPLGVLTFTGMAGSRPLRTSRVQIRPNAVAFVDVKPQ